MPKSREGEVDVESVVSPWSISLATIGPAIVVVAVEEVAVMALTVGTELAVAVLAEAQTIIMPAVPPESEPPAMVLQPNSPALHVRAFVALLQVPSCAPKKLLVEATLAEIAVVVAELVHDGAPFEFI